MASAIAGLFFLLTSRRVRDLIRDVKGLEDPSRFWSKVDRRGPADRVRKRNEVSEIAALRAALQRAEEVTAGSSTWRDATIIWRKRADAAEAALAKAEEEREEWKERWRVNLADGKASIKDAAAALKKAERERDAFWDSRDAAEAALKKAEEENDGYRLAHVEEMKAHVAVLDQRDAAEAALKKAEEELAKVRRECADEVEANANVRDATEARKAMLEEIIGDAADRMRTESPKRKT